MTTHAAAWRTAPQIFAGPYRRLRTAHPVRVLRWLQNAVLLSVAAAALLYLWVAVMAGHDIDAARRTSQAVADVVNAKSAAVAAENALDYVLNREDVTLTSTGSEYFSDITQVDKFLTLAAEGNGAGREGTSDIQFVSGTLQTYLQLSENAVSDYDTGPLGPAAETYASGGEKDLNSDLTDLEKAEDTALQRQLGAWPLDPGTFWPALLGPVIGLLLLVAATAQVLARHFRRHVSPWLWGSLLTTTATAVTVGFFNWSDERYYLSGHRWADHPATITVALLLFLAAGVQAYLAYRPRLAEYRFRPS